MQTESLYFVYRYVFVYLILSLHTVWSVAEHGPTDVLVQRLKPLLEKYNVTAYMCGHDHNLQHITDSNVQYYVTGAGHLIDPSMKHEVQMCIP